MSVNFSLPYDRLAETFRRVGHAIERGLALSEALLGVAVGSSVALASAGLLQLSDGRLTRLATAFTAPDAPPPIEGTRTVLLVVVFAGLIWAAGAWRKTREWFAASSNGGQP